MSSPPGMPPSPSSPDPDRPHRIGVVVNGVLAVVKIIGGLLSGSPSLLADGYHSVADLATGAVGWASSRLARRPPDEDHHYGHGKIEVLASLGVGGVLAWTGLEVMRDALGQQAAEYSRAELSIASAAAVVSLLANEWLVQVTSRAAREQDSSVLRALARDNRSDSLTSLLVLLALGAGTAGVTWAEPIATVLIGALILVMGARSLLEGYDVLTDRVADTGLRGRVEARARDVEGVVGVQSVRVHPIGSGVRIDMQISVDGELSVRKGHAIAHEVEDVVTRHEGAVVQVDVHVNPA